MQSFSFYLNIFSESFICERFVGRNELNTTRIQQVLVYLQIEIDFSVFCFAEWPFAKNVWQQRAANGGTH